MKPCAGPVRPAHPSQTPRTPGSRVPVRAGSFVPSATPLLLLARAACCLFQRLPLLLFLSPSRLFALLASNLAARPHAVVVFVVWPHRRGTPPLICVFSRQSRGHARGTLAHS